MIFPYCHTDLDFNFATQFSCMCKYDGNGRKIVERIDLQRDEDGKRSICIKYANESWRTQRMASSMTIRYGWLTTCWNDTCTAFLTVSTSHQHHYYYYELFACVCAIQSSYSGQNAQKQRSCDKILLRVAFELDFNKNVSVYRSKQEKIDSELEERDCGISCSV